MIPVLAALCTMVALTGVLVAVAAWRGVLPQGQTRSTSSTDLWTRAVDNVRAVRRATWLSLAAGGLVGVLGAYWLHLPVLMVVLPAAAVLLPALLADPPQDDIALLEALDRWIRSMLAQMSTGKSISDALRLSARQPPERLAEPLSHLVKRLDDRWTAPQALQAMADDLGSPDADAVLAALMLSAARGGTGASLTLYALAESLHDRLRALREIEAERAKPRVVVRQVTLISALALGAFMVLSPEFFAPYASPLGQIVLIVLLSAYLASVAAMRRMTLPRARGRILRSLS